MKKIYLHLFKIFIFLLLQNICLSQDQAQLNPSNLPAHLKNSTLFEWMRKRELTALPNTIQQLINELNYADVSPASAFIPIGRSAQANKADHINPRIIISSHTANKVADRIPIGFENYTAFPSSDYEGKIYFGFAKNASQMEVLSWNRDTKQFDFFIISDYDFSKVPLITEITQRKNCTKCHQNEAPIWTLPPWSEVMVHDPAEMFVKAKPAKETQNRLMYRDRGVLISNELTATENNMGLALDSASGAGNRLIQSSRIIKNVCQKNLECRKKILEMALTNLNYSQYIHKNFVKDTSAFGIDFVQGVFNNLALLKTQIPNGFFYDEISFPEIWPTHQFAYTSQLLTDPTFGVDGNSSTSSLDPLVGRGLLQAIDYKLATVMIWDTAFEVIGLNLEDARNLSKITLEDRVSKLNKTDSGDYAPAVKKILTEWNPKREDILNLFGLNSNLIAPIVQDEIKNDTKLFTKYCSRCHNPTQNENPVIEFADVEKRKNKAALIKKRLQAGTMPPSGEIQPSTEEKGVMLASFDGNANNQKVSSFSPVMQSHQGISYQAASGIQHSYILRGNTKIVEEGYVENCASGFGAMKKMEGNQVPQNAIIVGKTDDPNYPYAIALENFPDYILGYFVQIISSRDPSGSCLIYALTKVGNLKVLQTNRWNFPVSQLSTFTIPNAAAGTKINFIALPKQISDQRYPRTDANAKYILFDSAGNLFQTQNDQWQLTSYNFATNKFTSTKDFKNYLKMNRALSPNLLDRDSVLVIPEKSQVMRSEKVRPTRYIHDRLDQKKINN